jgi:hypothetical protein
MAVPILTGFGFCLTRGMGLNPKHKNQQTGYINFLSIVSFYNSI